MRLIMCDYGSTNTTFHSQVETQPRAAGVTCRDPPTSLFPTHLPRHHPHLGHRAYLACKALSESPHMTSHSHGPTLLRSSRLLIAKQFVACLHAVLGAGHDCVRQDGVPLT